MDEKYNLENFDSVWARVTESEDAVPAQISGEIRPEEKICIIKRGDKSRAIKYIPEI